MRKLAKIDLAAYLVYKDKKTAEKNKWKWKSVDPETVTKEAKKTFADVRAEFLQNKGMTPDEYFKKQIEPEIIADPNDDSLSSENEEENLKNLFDEELNID